MDILQSWVYEDNNSYLIDINDWEEEGAIAVHTLKILKKTEIKISTDP